MSNQRLFQKRAFWFLIISILIGTETIFAEGVRYLILTRPSFNEAIQPFADWKTKKGLKTKIVQFTTLPDTEDIKNSIRSYQPEYVLLVGDRDSIPLGRYFRYWRHSFPQKGTWTDQFYADITNNNGYKDDVYLGRFPCSTSAQCSNMVNKILCYERKPFISDSWFIKATGIARDTGPDPSNWESCYVAAIRQIYTMLRNSGFTHVDTFFRSHGANRESVETALNSGRGFVVYRGGTNPRNDNWWDPFNIIPERINNDSMPTIVISTTCRTMFFPESLPTYPRPESASGDRWLRHGSVTIPKGAAAFFGTTTHYYCDKFDTVQVYWRNAVAIRFFQAITEDPVFILGEAIRRAKDSAYACCSFYTSGQDSSAKACSVAYMEWNLLGDPELNLWTAIPQPLLVTHESIIHTGFQPFIVMVRDTNGEPINHALVCVVLNDSEVYKYGYTNPGGFVALPINPMNAGWLQVTVTARNRIPYEDSCLVEPIGKYATYPNQGRHLARAPKTLDLDWTYHTNIGTFWQTMGEMLVEPPVYIGEGKYPSIAKKDIPCPWVCNAGNRLLSGLIRRNDGTWKNVEVAQAETIGVPSLVLSIYPDANNVLGDLGYVVYTAELEETGERYICFSAFDSLDVYYTTTLDFGDVTEPSIAITPKDLLHIVWRKENRIYYVTTRNGITPEYIRSGGEPEWSIIDRVSTEDPLTEPASNPFVEAQGEWVYVVWRGPYDQNNPIGEIWQRPGRIQPGNIPQWRNPVNKSRTPTQESNFPTMSTGTAVVWQESMPGNYEIYANIITAFGERIVNVSNDSTNSFFPHTNLLPAPPWVQPDWRLFAVWTEESIPDTFYRIKFSNYYFSGPPPDTAVSPFSISGGDSIPSPYCLERDSFIDFGENSIDYAGSNLLYRLPYLDPKKSYLLKAVVYQDTTGIYRERFLFEDGKGKTVEFYPEEPETLGVIIPAGTYDTTVADIEIRKLLGEYSALAHLNLYEFEMVDEEGGGPQSLLTDDILSYTSLSSPFPNPFSRIQRIKYQLAKAGRVLLKVYDISGREVRVLTNETKEPGNYTDHFDGKDTKGRRLPFGVYFIRLKTEDLSDTKKVVLMR